MVPGGDHVLVSHQQEGEVGRGPGPFPAVQKGGFADDLFFQVFMDQGKEFLQKTVEPAKGPEIYFALVLIRDGGALYQGAEVLGADLGVKWVGHIFFCLSFTFFSAGW